jgi:hypothetical protein
MVIDYDRAAADYEASLVTKLRGHGAGSFLENWVPDPDPVLGIFNMIEAAWTGGREQFELLVSMATIDDGALARLTELAKPIAAMRVVSAAQGRRLEIQRVASRATGKGKQHPVPAMRTRATARADELEPHPEKAPIPALQPVLQQALEAETARFTHEANGAAKDGSIVLAVGDDELIRTARHRGVRPEIRRRLVEMMCREIEGRTVQDASDHAAVLVIHRLRQRADARPAAGILLPRNAGTEVHAALEMVRSACREHQRRSGRERKANFFELGPSAAWQALSSSEKLQRVAEATAAFCKAQAEAVAATKAVRLDKDIHGHEIRVIVQMDGALQGEGVPFLLRQLERFLKGNVEQALQVYLEPLKDKNVLRRL